MYSTGPGEVSFTRAAHSSITGENSTIAAMEPKISIVLFTREGNVLLKGTYRILITGSPRRSSVYGFVGMILL